MNRKPRQYEPIWNAIKNSKFGTWTEIRIHHSMRQTLIQAVRKEKAMHCATLRKIGEPTAGPLVMEISECPKNQDFLIIKFKLAWDETQI